WRIFYAVSAFYAIAAASMSTGRNLPAFYAAFALPLFVAVVGVLPFAPSPRKRAALRWQALLTVFVGFAAPHGPHAAADTATIAGSLLGAAVLWLLIADRLGAIEQSSLLSANRINESAFDWMDVAIVPLTLCFQASSAVEPLASPVLIQGVAAIIF